MNAQQVAERSAVYALDDAVAPMAGETFDLMATAPQGVAKLRELILALAVRGNLVPQIASEGTAATLLKENDEQRARLVVRGEAKRGKPLPPVAMNEPPFEIPSAWVWVRLGEVTNFGATDKATNVTDDTWVLDLEDIEKDTSKLLRRVRFEERRSLSAKNIFQRGDVLYGKLRPYLNKVIVADQTGVCTTEILPFRCFSPYDPSYFRVALQSTYFLNYVNGKSYGMKMPRLGTEDGRFALVPIPPLAEQRRIVARVEELTSLCDELEARGQLQDEQHARLVSTLFDTLVASASPAELADNWQRVAGHFDLLLDRPEAVDALEQTILHLAVRGLLMSQDPTDEPAKLLLAHILGEKKRSAKEMRDKSKAPQALPEQEGPFKLPAGWLWARFSDLGEFGRGKSKHRPRNDPRLFNPGIYPLIQTGEVSRADQFIEEIHSYYSEEGLAQSKLWPKGTLCITIAANIADSAMLKFEACFPDSVVGFVPSTIIGDARFFHMFMSTARQRLIDFAPATAQKNINLEVLNNLLVPIPPVAEMHRIIARVGELRGLCADLRKRLQQSQTTQASLADALAARAAA